MLKFFREMKARRMNKIVDEVTRQIEEKMDFLFDDFVSKLNGQLQDIAAPEIDYNQLACQIEISDVAEYIDLDDIRQEMQETKDEIISEVEGMISDAVDGLEITRG